MKNSALCDFFFYLTIDPNDLSVLCHWIEQFRQRKGILRIEILNDRLEKTW
jgi:ABC-type transporter Mla MlaB component